MPKLSIITICFNDRAGLEKTVRSVWNQTFTDYEYILIDGGSTDGSADFVKEYAERFAYAVSEKDKGIYNAQNKGWQKAQGEYCLFLNSGDFLEDVDTLSRFIKPELRADIVYGDLLVDNGEDPVYRIGQPDPFSFEDAVRSTLFHPCSLIKRNLLMEKNGYDESFRIVADYDFFIWAIFKQKCSTQYFPVDVTVFNTAGIGSDPANQKQHDEERDRVMYAYFAKNDVDEMKKVVQKKMPRSIRISKAVSGIPIIREMTNFGLLMYKRIRKSGG
jgi:glycosyltransferase involved in cell wall biosynthesis